MTDLLTAPAAASSVLAFVTTLHLGIAALINHRRQSGAAGILLVGVSLGLVTTPWLMPATVGLGVGLAAHAAWLAVCERLARQAGRGADVVPAARSGEVPRRARPARTSPWTRQFTELAVLAVVDETPEIRTFRLARPAGFTFQPGQFITVRLEIDGRDVTRCYSISSSPEATAYLEISVRRQGLVSEALHRTVRAGGTLRMMGPLGSFVYPSGDERPLVMIAGGVGITPIVSMIRHALATEPSRRVTLLYSARNDAEFAFGEELLALARRHHQFTVHRASSASGNAAVYPGRIDATLLGATVPDLAQSIVCMCGPGAMIGSMQVLLASLGVPPSQVRFELFEAAVAAATGGAAGAAAHRSQDAGASYTLTCLDSRKAVPIASGQTLLEAAEEADVELPSLCRAGICGTCRVQVTTGDVQCASASLAADDHRQGYVLACVSTVASDCTVHL